MHKAFAPLLASTLILAVAAHAEDRPDAAAAAGEKDYVILRVNGEDIKKSEVVERWKDAGKFIFQGQETPAFDTLDTEMKLKFLREMASEHALYQVAVKEGVDKTPEMQATFENLKHEALIQQLLKEKAKPASDEALKADYDAHIKAALAANGGRDEVHARHIVAATQEAADAIEKKLKKKGADFEKIAKEKSEDASTKENGGDLGWINPMKLSPAFGEVLLKLKKGEISEPFNVGKNWFILQLVDWRSLPPPPFTEVKDGLKEEENRKAITEYVSSVLKDVKITQFDSKGHAAEVSVIPKADAAPAKGGKEDTADK